MTDARDRAVEALHAERHAGRKCTMAELCPAWRDVTRDVAVLAAADVIQDRAEVKVLTETATRLGRELGRREAFGEVAEAFEGLIPFLFPGTPTADAVTQTAQNFRNLASPAAGATSDATSGVPGHPEVSEAVRSPQEPDCEVNGYHQTGPDEAHLRSQCDPSLCGWTRDATEEPK